MRIVVLLFFAIVSGFSTADCEDPCQANPDDAAILEAVFTELIVPRLKPGVVLLVDESAAPEFPSTVSQLERQKAIVDRLDEQPQPDESEVAAAFYETPRGIDLDLGDGKLVSKQMVDEAFSIEGCSLPAININGVNLVRFEISEYPSPWDFWDSVQEKHKSLGGLVQMTLPAYSPDGVDAVVSYRRMHGVVGGMGEIAYLRLIEGSWKIIWHETTFVS